MSLSQALLASVAVAEQLAQTSEKIGELKANLQSASIADLQQAELLRASLHIDGIEQSKLSLLATLYEQADVLDLSSEQAFKQVHAKLMHGRLDAGHYRSTGMGVYRNNRLVHMTAPANQITKLIRQLLPSHTHLPYHPLLYVANVLFDLEYIQPFSSANGIVGRLWIKAILQQWRPFLFNIPLEVRLLQVQESYFSKLKQAIADNDNSAFIAFVLQQIGESVDLLNERLSPNSVSNSSDKRTPHFSEKEHLPCSEKVSTREKLLQLLEQQPDWSAARAAEVLGISSRAVEKHLSRLKREGLLARQGSARAGRWIVTRPTTQQLSLPEY